ncbi:MAG: hypothetical protein IKB01_10575 [Lachnospiraceae bacterium]|nr:hypothetical protein [Lachnospiraceae bacterium]
MNLSPVVLMQFKNTVERILHVPGNYKGGVLEMAVVLDHNVSREAVGELVPQLFRSLKMHSQVFRNVRLNMVQWESDEAISGQVTPMSMAGLSTYYENYGCRPVRKDFMKLVQYLKLFQARAKLIILVTDGANEEGSKESVKAAMQPFLDKKLMQVVVKEWNEGFQDIQVCWR